MNNKGVSMISLIIIIIMIVIIAAISVPLLSNVISDSIMEDARVEMKNVETVMGYAKAEIMNGSYMPNEAYKISDAELESKFGSILTAEEKNEIKAINNSVEIQAPHKYYLMNQQRFDNEFRNDFNVTGIREGRDYLINYMDGIVVVNLDGRRVTNGNSITVIPVEELQRGEVYVNFSPNGNSEWSTQQSTIVSYVTKDTTINSIKYVWSQSISAPEDSYFDNTLTNHSVVTLDEVTGNNWYLWVRIQYTDDGVDRTTYVKSEPFYIDNTAPTAVLSVDSIRK